VGKIKIGVTGTGSLIGQGIVKTIRISSISKKIFIIGFDYFNHTPGSFWVERNYLLPDILKKNITEEEWLKAVTDAIKLEQISILFVGVHFELKLFAKHREFIESLTGCKVIISSPEAIEIANDKYLTYEFLKNNNLYYPETILPQEVWQKKIKFPCIVKPRKGSRSRGLFVVIDENELAYYLPRIEDPIIQEFIGNENVEYTCGTLYLDSEIKHAIVLRRVLVDGNTQSAYYSKNAPAVIYDYISDVTRKLKPLGACNFQLRLDDCGTPKIFEINMRHSGTTYMRALFGFNEVEYIIAYLLGMKLPEPVLKEGMVKRYYEEMFIDGK